MLLLISHIIIALTSLVWTSWLLWHPSVRKLQTNFVLIAATLLSGTLLTWRAHAPMLQACLSGFAYCLIVTAGTIAARVKLTSHLHTTTVSTSIK